MRAPWQQCAGIRQRKCQSACKPGSGWPPLRGDVTAIPLGRLLPDASSNQPGRQTGDVLTRLPGPCRPYSVLLPVGLAMPEPLPALRCALTAPFHPYRVHALAVRSLWRFPWGRPRRTLSGTVSPWSPDFPRPLAGPRPSSRLARVSWSPWLPASSTWHTGAPERSMEVKTF